MFTTLQKEYAILFYIRYKLGQEDNNGFLHELYTEKNVKSILEKLVNNKTKETSTISTEQVVERVLPSVNIDTLTNPRARHPKFNVLPYNPVSFMELYMGKTINNVLMNMKERIFVDDITDAKDGMAAYFVSIFSRNMMVNDNFAKFATIEQHPSADKIVHTLRTQFPDSYLANDTEALSKYATQMVRENFTHKDLGTVIMYLQKKFGNSLNRTSIVNAIASATKYKENDEDTTFDEIRDAAEESTMAMVQSTSSIDNMFKTSAKYRFSGTMKYKRGAKDSSGNTAPNTIELSLRKQDMEGKLHIDCFTQFITVLNNLLRLEGLPGVNTSQYNGLNTVLLSEEQYHALFPEYFVTVGILKTKEKTATEMGTTMMKSGDESTNIIDRYTGEDEDKYDSEDEETYDSSVLTLGKTKKLMLAKMLATLNGHPETVPDQIESAKGKKSAIYELNRIFITELFNSPYPTIQALVGFLTHDELPPDMESHDDELFILRQKYLKDNAEDAKVFGERDINVKAFATVLSELSKAAHMGPNDRLPSQDIVISNGTNRYVLTGLPSVVNAMVAHAIKGQYVEGITVTSKNPIYDAINFLIKSNLLRKNGKTYVLVTDANQINSIVDSLPWKQLETLHHTMMVTALHNCSYLYKQNGWVKMTPQERSRHEYEKIKDDAKTKDDFYFTGKLVKIMESVQGNVKPYFDDLRDINDVIARIKMDYGITSVEPAQAPTVDENTLSVNDRVIQMFSTDDSSEAIDSLSQDYYLRSVESKYEEIVDKKCKEVTAALKQNKHLDEDTRKALIRKFGHVGGKTKIINRVFDGVKKSASSNVAEKFNKQDEQRMFQIAQDVIRLYNFVRNDVGKHNPTIAKEFPQTRQYVQSADLDTMSKGQSQTGKNYTENGSAVDKDFLLNAYLIDVLFETIYLMTILFDLPAQTEYSVQDITQMSDVSEMIRYIKENMNIAMEGNMVYTQLLTAIKRKSNILFNSPMLNIIIAVMLSNPDMKQLSVGEANKINGKNRHLTSGKVLSDIAARQMAHVTANSRKRTR